MTTPLPDPFTGNHGALEDKVRELSLLPPTHSHGVSQITGTGTRSSETFFTGAGTFAPIWIDKVGLPTAPSSNASAARPAAVLVYWFMAAGVSPVNKTGADIVWNAP
jgi:hypothetical protein